MNALLVLVSIIASSMASAAVPAIQPSSAAYDVAATASSIWQVASVQAGTFYYKVVEMDSRLNGDLDSTILVFVGKMPQNMTATTRFFRLGLTFSEIYAQ